MSRVEGIVFAVIVGLCLCVPFGWQAIVALTPLETPEYSSIEKRDYEQFPEVSLFALADGTFQDSFEQFVADSVPARDDVLFANARVQRAVIELSNLAFSFDCWPTYFGSTRAYSKSHNVLFDIPRTTLKFTSEKLDKWTKKYTNMIEASPEVDWVFCLADKDLSSKANPAYDLCASTADRDVISEGFLSRLPEECEVVGVTYEDTDAYYEKYYKNDYHWNIKGALEAYEEISSALGIEPVASEDDVFCVAHDQERLGSALRIGLSKQVTKDDFFDVAYAESELSVTVDGEEEDADWLVAYKNSDGGDADADESKTYFHSNVGIITIHNEDLDNGETLLIIGDSFSNSIERLFAESYETVISFDPRNNKTDLRVRDIIDLYDVDDAVFIMCQTSL